MWFFRRKPTTPLPAEVHAYQQAALADRRSPWRDLRYCVLDLETSGLDPAHDAILSIGLVEIAAGRIHLNRTWQTNIRPPVGVTVPARSIVVHGLLNTDVAAAPLLAEVLPTLMQYLSGRILIVHVAAVDVAFLNRALEQTYAIKLRGWCLDTARLALTLAEQDRFLHGQSMPSQPIIQLRALAEQAGLPVFGEHDALNDALTTAQLFLAQASQLEQRGSPTLGGLLAAGGCLR
jgi:DNA polymerase-3 subunit epsilon